MMKREDDTSLTKDKTDIQMKQSESSSSPSLTPSFAMSSQRKAEESVGTGVIDCALGVLDIAASPAGTDLQQCFLPDDEMKNKFMNASTTTPESIVFNFSKGNCSSDESSIEGDESSIEDAFSKSNSRAKMRKGSSVPASFSTPQFEEETRRKREKLLDNMDSIHQLIHKSAKKNLKDLDDSSVESDYISADHDSHGLR